MSGGKNRIEKKIIKVRGYKPRSGISAPPIRSSSCTSNPPADEEGSLSWIHPAPVLKNPADPKSMRQWRKEFFEWWIRQPLVAFVHPQLWRQLPVDLQGGTTLAIRAIDVMLRRLYRLRRNAPSGWNKASSQLDPDVIAKAVLNGALQELSEGTEEFSFCIEWPSRKPTPKSSAAKVKKGNK